MSKENNAAMQERLERIVSGELRNTIKAHGPISDQWIGSATKRIVHQLCAYLTTDQGQHDILDDILEQHPPEQPKV